MNGATSRDSSSNKTGFFIRRGFLLDKPATPTTKKKSTTKLLSDPLLPRNDEDKKESSSLIPSTTNEAAVVESSSSVHTNNSHDNGNKKHGRKQQVPCSERLEFDDDNNNSNQDHNDGNHHAIFSSSPPLIVEEAEAEEADPIEIRNKTERSSSIITNVAGITTTTTTRNDNTSYKMKQYDDDDDDDEERDLSFPRSGEEISSAKGTKDDDDDTTNMIMIRQELVSILYQIRRLSTTTITTTSNNNREMRKQDRKYRQQLLQRFVQIVEQQQSLQMMAMVWELICDSQSVDVGVHMLLLRLYPATTNSGTNQKTASVVLLDTAFLDFFRTTNDKQSRTRCLVAIAIVQEILDQMKNDFLIAGRQPQTRRKHQQGTERKMAASPQLFMVAEFVQCLLPLLVKIGGSSCKKPLTVLSQRAMDASYQILATASLWWMIVLQQQQKQQPSSSPDPQQQQQSSSSSSFSSSSSADMKTLLFDSLQGASSSVRDLCRVEWMWLMQKEEAKDDSIASNLQHNGDEILSFGKSVLSSWTLRRGQTEESCPWSVSYRELQRRCRLSVLYDHWKRFFCCSFPEKFYSTDEDPTYIQQLFLLSATSLGTARRGSSKHVIRLLQRYDGGGERDKQSCDDDDDDENIDSQGFLLDWMERVPMRIVVRGLLAYWGQNRKHLQRIDAEVVADISTRLLQELIAEHSFDYREVIQIALRVLWTRSSHVPPDIRAFSNKQSGEKLSLPSSISQIFGFLSLKKEKDHDNERTLTFLYETMSQCIMAHSHSMDLVDALLSEYGFTDVVGRVLISVASVHQVGTAIADSLFQLLMEKSTSSSSNCLRELLVRDSVAFSQCSMAVMVTSIVQAVVASDKDMQRTAILMDLLVHRFKTLAQTEDRRRFVAHVILAFRCCNENGSQVETSIADIGRRLRACVCRGESSESEFGITLVNIGKEFLNNPSDLLPLLLFGKFVDFESDEKEIDSTSIFIAVTDLLSLILDDMNAKGTISAPSTQEKIFRQLAPLLLLRRVPVSLFRLARKHSSELDQQSFCNLSENVWQALDADLSHSNLDISQKQRQLSAENLSRLLPLDDLWRRTCLPRFQELSSCIQQHNNDVPVAMVKDASLALFVFCLCIENTERSDDAACLQDVAPFALQFLAVDVELLGDTEEFEKLQTGCVEFFSLCIQSSFQSSSLIPNTDSGHHAGKHNLRQEVEAITVLLKKVLQNGFELEPRIQASASDPMHCILSADSGIGFPVHLHLWKSLLLACQRCTESDQRLTKLSNSILPWLSTLLIKAGSPNKLCLAASMQIAFVLLMRTKSLAKLTVGETRHVSTVQRIHRLVINTLSQSSDCSDVSTRAVRSSSLSLLTALVSLVDFSAKSPPLSTADVLETLSLVHDLSKTADDAFVRQMATEIIGILQHT